MDTTQDKGVAACPGCGKVFVCGISAGQSSCWCMEKPLGLPVPVAGGEAKCWCPECLQRRVSESAAEAG